MKLEIKDENNLHIVAENVPEQVWLAQWVKRFGKEDTIDRIMHRATQQEDLRALETSLKPFQEPRDYDRIQSVTFGTTKTVSGIIGEMAGK